MNLPVDTKPKWPGDVPVRDLFAEGEFTFVTEPRKIHVNILKRCPSCGRKPFVKKTWSQTENCALFTVRHGEIVNFPLNCPSDNLPPSKSIEAAIRSWQLSVTLAT